MTHEPARKQVDPEHYRFASYVSMDRWASFWYQLVEVLALEPSSVLEIGVGPGVFRVMMNHLGVALETVDIDPELKPDHVASVLELPFADASFDVVACFQVLEHIPYESFVRALHEIRRVSRGRAVISLPDAGRYFRLLVTLPKIGTRWLGLSVPRARLPLHAFDGQHHWEINKRSYAFNRVLRDIESTGFRVVRSYRPWENPYHRVLLLA